MEVFSLMRIGKLLPGLVVLAVCGLAQDPNLTRARELYEQTKYDEALAVLEGIPGKDGAVHRLAGKCQYQLDDYKKASDTLEKAVKADPGSSESYDWLGKAYGRRAEHSSFLSAPGYASKARAAFQRAVELDPKNEEAISDLFDYYMDAPGFLGGGLDKAAQLAERIRVLDPAEYHSYQARLAEKTKELAKAEQQLRMAAMLAPRQVGRLIDLAKFLAKQGRYQESDSAFLEAQRVAPNDPQLLFAQASEYIRANRNLPMARQLLERYLNSTLTPDHPSRKEAERLLKLAASG
jgi:tetratricopeptide (TPR) repeat protein